MKFILIKLFIGLVLFGTLVALAVLNVPNVDNIKQLCEGGLLGLGIMHLGAQSAAASVKPDQGGFASIPLLLAMALGAAFLTACTTATPQQTAVTYTQACASYGAAFDVALQLRRADKLNPSQIEQVTLLDQQITPICTGPLPPDPAAATQQVVNAVTLITALELVKP